jgi:hypothetical protein
VNATRAGAIRPAFFVTATAVSSFTASSPIPDVPGGSSVFDSALLAFPIPEVACSQSTPDTPRGFVVFHLELPTPGTETRDSPLTL